MNSRSRIWLDVGAGLSMRASPDNPRLEPLELPSVGMMMLGSTSVPQFGCDRLRFAP